MRFKKLLRKHMKGSISVFVFIMIGLVIGMYLFGFASPMVAYFGEKVLSDESGMNQGISIEDFLGDIVEAVKTPFGYGSLAIMAGIGLLTVFSGVGYASQTIFSFLIPVFFLFLIANVFFFPIVPFVESQGFSDLNPVGLIMTLVFNVMLMLSVIEFVSGRN